MLRPLSLTRDSEGKEQGGLGVGGVVGTNILSGPSPREVDKYMVGEVWGPGKGHPGNKIPNSTMVSTVGLGLESSTWGPEDHQGNYKEDHGVVPVGSYGGGKAVGAGED